MDYTWCVYRHTVPDGRMYIGIAQEPAKIRWSNGGGYRENPPFWECIKSVGWENITHEILIGGLDKREARKKESEFIEKFGTLIPNGFNRRFDDGRSYKKKLKEIGDKHGYSEVVDYWPDKEGYKEYRMRCSCGKLFVCKGRDITDDLSCGCKSQCV